MAATITHRVATPDTGNTPNASGAFSFASGDLVVVFVTKEASVPSTYASGDLTCANLTGVSTFTLITAVGIDTSNVDGLGVWVANQKCSGAGATATVTIGSGSDAGAGSNIAVFTVAGLHASALGAAAVRQSGSLAVQASGVVPSIDLSTGVALTENAIVGGIGVVDGTPALTASASFTEGADTGYTTGKAQGLETVFRNSGHTSQTVNGWTTATTGGNWGGIVLELNTVLIRTERRLGTVTPSGTRSESKSHTSKPIGVISLAGTRSESWIVSGPSYTDRVSGTIRLARGIRAETKALNPSLYWPLDATYGGNDQSSGGANDGSGGGGITLGGYAGSPIADEATATDFDGTDDYVSNASYSPWVNGRATSFAAWVKKDDFAGYQAFFTNDSGSVFEAAYFPDVATQLWFWAFDAGTEQENLGNLPASGVGWMHLAVVFDEPNDTVTGYFNGIAQAPQSHTSAWNTGTGIRIGLLREGSWPIDGQMAHFAVFEYGLTAAQVSLLWESRTGASNAKDSNTHVSKPTGTIVLAGTRVESHAVTRTDKVSGTVTLAGTRRESKSRSVRTTGSLTVLGTRRESLSHNPKPSAQILLQGTIREQYLGATTDRRSGTITLTGTRTESRSHTSKPTGTIQLQGTVREQNLGPTIDRRSGTISVTGSRSESLSGTERRTGTVSVSGTRREQYVLPTIDRRTGTVTLSGTVKEQFAGTHVARVSGTISLLGTRSESSSETTKPTGTIALQGTRSESYGRIYTNRVSGTITLSGTRQESYGRSYIDAVSGIISLAGTWTESKTRTAVLSGQITLLGTRSESKTSTEEVSGIIVLTGQPGELYVPSGLVIDRASGIIRLIGGMRELHSRWDNLGGERWPPDTDSRWPGDQGDRWAPDDDDRWGYDAPERWETDLVT